jgi:CRP/FNR family cyclic AMP-dependent transcriptional regulator
MSGTSPIDIFRGIGLFSGCTADELELIDQAADELDVPAGKVLMQQDAQGREAVVVVSGTASVSRGGEVIATVGPGDCVGELALLDGGLRTATVTALEPMVVQVISSVRFGPLLADVPSLSTKLLASVASQLRSLDDRLV